MGDLLRGGPISSQVAILPAHAAVSAVLAAKVGNFDHPAHKDFAAKALPGGRGGALVKRGLVGARGRQVAFVREIGRFTASINVDTAAGRKLFLAEIERYQTRSAAGGLSRRCVQPHLMDKFLTKERVVLLARKAINLAIVTIVFGFLYDWASPWAYSKTVPAGFFRGMLHGALMPIALPSLVIGKDVPIFATLNIGRLYKIGYIAGINLCGLAFFGPMFWRPASKESKKQDLQIIPHVGRLVRRYLPTRRDVERNT